MEGREQQYRLVVPERAKERLDHTVAGCIQCFGLLSSQGRWDHCFVVRRGYLGAQTSPALSPRLLAPRGSLLSLLCILGKMVQCMHH